MNSSEDTIAAIATAPGEAGISIIRVSGPAALAVADKIFRCQGKAPSKRNPSTFVIGHIVDREEQHIDQALLLIMRAPHSYTGEDTVEFQCHGGTVNARRILGRILDAGARSAEPGEFTKRAFLNGRIDLLQAEAVLDLIKAKSERAAIAAVNQLDGSLTSRINACYDDVLAAASDLEATLDFPDDEIPTTVLDNVVVRLDAVADKMSALLATWNEGHLLRDGAAVVISGRPNAGKSTLLNSLIGRDRAIVSDKPGTTRDVIEEGATIGGIAIKLVDTAGLRHTDDNIEMEGVARAKAEIGKADLHLYVIDSSATLNEEDVRHTATLDKGRCIVVLNKTDLGDRCDGSIFKDLSVARTSLMTGDGLDELKSLITAKLGSSSATSGSQNSAISERHRALLDESLLRVKAARDLLSRDVGASSDLAATELRSALESLGQVTGRVYQSELLDSIFSRFCIGK